MTDLTGRANKAISKRPEDNLILVDCSETLYAGVFGERNDDLIKYLAAMRAVGYKIQIFSNDPIGSQMMLATLSLGMKMDGLHFDFGQVKSKDLFNGEKAFIVIDDDHSTHKVDCPNQYSPTDERIAKTLSYVDTIDTNFGKRDLN